MVQSGCQRRSEIYTPIHLLASELGLPICCLLLAMRAMARCHPVSTFSHIEETATFQALKSKIGELTDMIGFGEFPSLSLESLSVITSMHYECYLYEKNKSLKNNLSGDRLPSTLDALVLHLRRVLIFFINICLMYFLNSSLSFIKTYKI